MTKITTKAQSVLTTIAAGSNTRETIAEMLGVSVPTVNGSLTGLKRHGLIKVDKEGSIVTTAAAKPFLTEGAAAPVQGHRAGTKMAEAAKLFNDKYAQGRQAVLAAFQDRIGLTKAGAATYYQMLRTQAGMAEQVKPQKKSAQRTRAH